jgi:hypothetical protein
VRNCVNCTFTIACKQLRLRDCSHTTLYLYSKTRPALESSHHMLLAPFNGSYPRQRIHFKQAGLDPEFNKWDQVLLARLPPPTAASLTWRAQVHDFSARIAEIPKPHWGKLPDAKYEEWEIKLDGVSAKPDNPVTPSHAPAPACPRHSIATRSSLMLTLSFRWRSSRTRCGSPRRHLAGAPRSWGSKGVRASRRRRLSFLRSGPNSDEIGLGPGTT